MREKIISWNGEFRYNTKLTNIFINNNKINGIEVNNNDIIYCDNLILAIGHSARDTFNLLNNIGLVLEAKPFAVGIRIQHPQNLIDYNQYGRADNDFLPAATYKLTYTSKKKRGVYSFCMCPGGYVINASSEKGYLAINGMSNHNRDSGMANSAIVVAVNSKDYGDDVFSGIEFQRELEKKAYLIGNGKIPTQFYKDYKNNVLSKNSEKINGKFKGKYQMVNINEILPDFINEALVEAIDEFSKKIKGFNSDDILISAVESRTSSPIRILRDDSYQASIKGIYPIGEGAGYAGGITSCAVDGLKIAKKIIEIYKP